MLITNRIEEIVWLLKNNLDYGTSKSKLHFERVVFLDQGISNVELEDLNSPRVLKTHLLLQFLPENFYLESKVLNLLTLLT